MIIQFSRTRFFLQIFDLGNSFEHFDQKVPKNGQKFDFWQKITILTFKVKIFKNIA